MELLGVHLSAVCDQFPAALLLSPNVYLSQLWSPARNHSESLNATAAGLIIDNIMNALWKAPKDSDSFQLIGQKLLILQKYKAIAVRG